MWPEINKVAATWSIAPTRTKNGLPHVVPLSSTAIELLATQRVLDGRELVFGSRDGPFQGWSNAKAALDLRITATNGGTPIKPWRLHDLRRTVATRLGDLGTLPHVVEAVLNHVSGHRAGVAGIYNRAVYSAEKREALELWSAHVEKLVLR